MGVGRVPTKIQRTQQIHKVLYASMDLNCVPYEKANFWPKILEEKKLASCASTLSPMPTMGTSTVPDRKKLLNLSPCKPSHNVVYGYLLLRATFVAASMGLAAWAALQARPLLQKNSDVEVGHCIASTLFWCIAAFLFWIAQPLGPSAQSQARCQSDKVATVSWTPQGWVLCEPTEKFRKSSTKSVLFVLYCAPKLHPTQYASLAKEVAKQGISTLMVQQPLGLFFTQPAKASTVIEAMHPTFTHFVLGGHDMGANFVCDFAKDLSGQNELAGAVLMGALIKTKKTDLSEVRGSDGPLRVALVNGTRSKLICQHVDMRHNGSVKTWMSKARAFLPEGACIRNIKDGNHFGFADRSLGYLEGFPFNDNATSIPRELQQRETAIIVAQVALALPTNTLPPSR